MKGLTEKERKILGDYLDGKLPEKEDYKAILNALIEGRITEDKSAVTDRLRARNKMLMVRALIGNLMEKRERKIYLPKEDMKILQDYEEKGILPNIDHLFSNS